MRKTLLLFFIFLCPFFLQAQTFTVSADKMNVAYIGIDNKLTIVADNCTCANLYATTENGELIKKDSCRFIYRPVNMGATTINIKKRQNGKITVIDKKVVRVKSIPDPRVMVGGKSSGLIPASFLKGQQGLTIGFEQGCELDLKCLILSFRVVFFPKFGDVETEDIKGSRFSANTISIFNHLKEGDRILFENIKATGPDKINRSLNPMSFTIK